MKRAVKIVAVLTSLSIMLGLGCKKEEQAPPGGTGAPAAGLPGGEERSDSARPGGGGR